MLKFSIRMACRDLAWDEWEFAALASLDFGFSCWTLPSLCSQLYVVREFCQSAWCYVFLVYFAHGLNAFDSDAWPCFGLPRLVKWKIPHEHFGKWWHLDQRISFVLRDFQYLAWDEWEFAALASSYQTKVGEDLRWSQATSFWRFLATASEPGDASLLLGWIWFDQRWWSRLQPEDWSQSRVQPGLCWIVFDYLFL